MAVTTEQLLQDIEDSARDIRNAVDERNRLLQETGIGAWLSKRLGLTDIKIHMQDKLIHMNRGTMKLGAFAYSSRPDAVKGFSLDALQSHYDLIDKDGAIVRDPDMDTLPDGTQVQYPADLPKAPFSVTASSKGRE